MNPTSKQRLVLHLNLHHGGVSDATSKRELQLRHGELKARLVRKGKACDWRA